MMYRETFCDKIDRFDVDQTSMRPRVFSSTRLIDIEQLFHTSSSLNKWKIQTKAQNIIFAINITYVYDTSKNTYCLLIIKFI